MRGEHVSGKRGQGEGAIYRRADGRWEAKFRVGGVRRSVYARTRAEALARMRGTITAAEDGLVITTAKDTVAVFLTDWLKTVEPTLDENGYERYEQHVRLHLVPTIGRIQLDRLTPKHLQDAYVNQLKAGSSPSTIRGTRAVIHKALEDAMGWGLVRRNVASYSRSPKVPKYEAKPLTPEQTKRVLAAAKGDRLEALYTLVATVGMREGELLGLRWKDVHLDEANLSVTGQLQRTKKKGLHIKELKTSGSPRQLALTPGAVAALRTHHVRQAKERLKAGPDWDPRGIVFTTHTGGPLESSNFTRRYFKPLLTKAKVPEVRFHDLRHTASSLMLAQGVHPKVVSEILGHSSIGITMDIYSHLMPGLQEEAARLMQELLWGPPR